MRIHADEIQSLLASYPRLPGRKRRLSLDRLIAKLRTTMRASIEAHMQAPVVLLEQALRVSLEFERHQSSFRPTVERREFSLHISKLRADVLSIREMVRLGQESAAYALARVFIEDLEVAMALAVDPDFSLGYGEPQSENDFWAKHIAYGKIYPLVRRFVAQGGGDERTADEKLEHHKRLKSFLSSHIHSSSSSVFRAAFPASLEHPGLMHSRPLGALSDGIFPLCLTIADEVQLFASACINMLISPSPPSALSAYAPTPELDQFVAEAHVLQELCMKYLDPLWEEYSNALASWKRGVAAE